MNFKSFVTNEVSKWLSVNFVELCEKVKKAGLITFDVFDTIVYRTTGGPSSVFEEVGKIFKNDLGSLRSYSELRIRAESLARSRVSREINYEEIFEAMPCIDGGLSMDLIEKLKETELQVEKAVVKPRPDAVFFLNWASQSKDIAFISDMYLGESTIRDILSNSGLDINDFRLFVSSDYGVTKRSGELFNEALSRIGSSKAEVVHVGDSLRADYLGARRVGVTSYLIKRYQGSSN